MHCDDLFVALQELLTYRSRYQSTPTNEGALRRDHQFALRLCCLRSTTSRLCCPLCALCRQARAIVAVPAASDLRPQDLGAGEAPCMDRGTGCPFSLIPHCFSVLRGGSCAQTHSLGCLVVLCYSRAIRRSGSRCWPTLAAPSPQGLQVLAFDSLAVSISDLLAPYRVSAFAL